MSATISGFPAKTIAHLTELRTVFLHILLYTLGSYRSPEAAFLGGGF